MTEQRARWGPARLPRSRPATTPGSRETSHASSSTSESSGNTPSLSSSGEKGSPKVGQAREVMDRLTDAIFSRDWEAVAGLYAPEGVAVTPDQGEVQGNRAIAEWSREFLEAFPDARYE